MIKNRFFYHKYLIQQIIQQKRTIIRQIIQNRTNYGVNYLKFENIMDIEQSNAVKEQDLDQESKFVSQEFKEGESSSSTSPKGSSIGLILYVAICK
jgi:hypothetical protein